MSHFALFPWIMIQIFIAHTASATVLRGVIGQPVQLPCFYQVTRNTDISDMCWGRGPCPNSKCNNKILHTTGNRVTFRKSQRYNLQGYISYGDVSLTIGKVKAEDAGTYCCRIEIPGWFNDIKKNMRLEVVRAPPVKTTTTRKAPVSPRHFRKTTFAPQATSDHQTTSETTVLLTTTTPKVTSATTDHQTSETAVPLPTTIPIVTTATIEPPAVITLETIAPPTFAVTVNDVFPETMVTTGALLDFSTGFQADDMMTEDDDIFCPPESVPCPGGTNETTEFSSTLPTAEGTKSADTSFMVEDLSATGISESPDDKAENLDDNRHKVIHVVYHDKPGKHTQKFIIKSLGPVEDLEKVFSGSEGENNIFSL
ncbi:PREDICTED: T-cell immunoglobulin and mucin domain-containing protein 4-like [Eurypyga helias]|uniref:T-cell immunoglobulin and mucin domain-containing protein 4-like n=1 Tax=Eurypyga helias TaxID=54383 RepID=UPI000529526F|nr:PREDICTED: T-cell immunoglobulin and mucin domain-containing protein 4-like [Eurypyga helias]